MKKRKEDYDNHHEDMYKYCVRSLKDLKEKIIPLNRKSRPKFSELLRDYTPDLDVTSGKI